MSSGRPASDDAIEKNSLWNEFLFTRKGILCQEEITPEFSEFLSEVKTELKIIKASGLHSLHRSLIGIKQIENPIGNDIVKEARNSKNPL